MLKNMPAYNRLVPSLVQLLRSSLQCIYIITYIDWANSQTGPSLAMPLGYMLLLAIDYFSISTWETTVTARLRIVAKHLPIIRMPLHPRSGP